MRILQLTDLHIGEEGEDTYGVDVRSNFLKIIDFAKTLQPDRIVLTGDLCFRSGNTDIYFWIKYLLDQLAVPFDVISGNHDDPAQLAKVFGTFSDLHRGELYFARNFGECPALFLDTTVGSLSQRQLDWLQQQLQAIQQELLLFMHHPPLIAGVPYMDKSHALKPESRKALQDILFGFSWQIHAFCGHYHVEKIVAEKNVAVHITPSCFFQIDPVAETFRIDHHRIGLREIIVKDKKIRQRVRYLPT